MSVLQGADAIGAAPRDREMAHVDREGATVLEGVDERSRLVGVDLPRRPAAVAMEMTVDRGRQDVELLASVGAVAMAQEAELLEDVERPIDGRGDRLGIDRPTAIDELGAGHVTVGLREDLDQG